MVSFILKSIYLWSIKMKKLPVKLPIPLLRLRIKNLRDNAPTYDIVNSLKENEIDGLTYPSYGSDLASYKFWSFSVIKEALYDKRFESSRTVKIVIFQCIKGVPKDA